MTRSYAFIKNKLKIILIITACFMLAFLLLKHPRLSSEGIQSGLELCSQTMIPSLFPFLVLSSFLLRSGINESIGKRTDKFFSKVFNFSGMSGGVFLAGIFSGFPVGANMAKTLYENKKISREDAQRLILCSVNAGPAFVIGAVGSSMLSSTKAGAILFASLSLSSALIAFLSRFIFEKSTPVYTEINKRDSLSSAFVNSVGDATTSMLSISAWIVLFSCLCNIASGKIDSDVFKTALRCVSEVSVGCETSAKSGNLPLLAGVLGWSGLCVHCQVLPSIVKTGLPIRLFFASKLFNAVTASLFCYVIMKIFPCEISVFSSGSLPVFKAFAVSGPAAAGLLLMCAILILDLDTDKKVC